MKKGYKILIITALFISGLSFTAWNVFNYYWRTQGTVNTFSTFTEPEALSFSKIKWVEDSFGTFKTDISAFFIKVELNGVDDSFYMQFDTGTSQTLFYGKTLHALKAKHPSFEPVESQSGNYWLKSPVLKIGDLNFGARDLLVKADLGSEEIDPSFTIIGTIGFDAIVGRKLILDFKNNQLTITNKDINKLNYIFKPLEGASLDRFPILIPAEVDGEDVQLLYDTGSSMFPLIVDNQKLLHIENAGRTDTLCCITSWGKSYDFYRRKLNTDIKIGNLVEKQPYVYSSKSMDQYDYFPNWLMMGIAGNHMFIDKILLIDTQNNIFGICD
jgi:hypothetical protein